MTESLTRKPPYKLKKAIFVICPVRPPKIGSISKTQNAISAYVAELETNDYKVYWPTRDNPHQNTDKNGISICRYNREKMFWADEIHIWYDKNSVGSVFDIGMFFMFVLAKDFKKFVIINRKDIAPTPYESFENLILTLAKEFDNSVSDGLKEKLAKHEK